MQRLSLTLAALAVTGVLSLGYLVFVMSFAVNVPIGDEWNDVVPFVHEAIHNHLAINTLWLQHGNPSHLLIPNSIFIIIGKWGQFNTKILIAMSALLQIASFVSLLAIFGIYTQKKITAVSVAVLGVTWFSLGGIDNALWGFQIQIYLTVFLLCLIPCLLYLGRDSGRGRAFAFAGSIVCSIAVSCCTIQGLLAWPVGLLVLLWAGRETKGQRQRVLLWCGAAIVMIGVYLIEYNPNLPNSGCLGGARTCSVSYGLRHPGATIQYFFALLGNASASRDSVLFTGGNAHLLDYRLFGGVLLVSAILVGIWSFRDRKSAVLVSSMPVALILSGVLWDISIAVSRVGLGQATAVGSHYTTPQILVLSGVLMFGLVQLSHEVNGGCAIPKLESSRLRLLGLVMLGLVVVALAVISTGVGIDNARLDRLNAVMGARIVVNLDRIPTTARSCYLDAGIDDGIPVSQKQLTISMEEITELREDHLSVFAPTVYSHYRAEGPPKLPFCK